MNFKCRIHIVIQINVKYVAYGLTFDRNVTRTVYHTISLTLTNFLSKKKNYKFINYFLANLLTNAKKSQSYNNLLYEIVWILYFNLVNENEIITFSFY